MLLSLQPFSSVFATFQFRPTKIQICASSSFHINQFSKVIYPRKMKQKLYIKYLLPEWLSIRKKEVKTQGF